MKRFVAAAVGVVLSAVLASTAAAQVPTEDSVTGTGTTSNGFLFDIDARSDPDGANPTGEVSFRFSNGGAVFFAGSVTCLAVEGSIANIWV